MARLIWRTGHASLTVTDDHVDGNQPVSAVRVPTLVAIEDRDRICRPDDARTLAMRIPGARFHVISRCGHLSPMERPGEVTMLLRAWLHDGVGRHPRHP